MADEEQRTEDAAEPKTPPLDVPPPPNKLYEWGAAVGIMFALALILWVFLSFIRGASQ